MADRQQKESAKGGANLMGHTWRVPMLPPVQQRDALREEWLRRLHWKDIDASTVGDGGLSGMWLRKPPGTTAFAPWTPICPAPEGDIGPILGKPTATDGVTVQLSQQGQSDQSILTPVNEAKKTAEEGEKRPPNVTIKGQDSDNAKQKAAEEKSPWKFGSEVELKSELEQPKVKFGGSSGKTLRQAASESLGQSAKKFDTKYPKLDEIGVGGEYTAWDKSDEFRKVEGKVGPAEGNLRVFYGDTKASAKGSISRSGAKGEAGAGVDVGMLKGEVKAGNEKSLLAGKAEGRVASVDAKGKVEAEIKFKEVEATASGSLGASAVLLEGEIGGEIRITPRRVWNGVVVSGVNTAADWFGYGKQLENIDGWDWGIMLGGSIGGTVGLSAEAEASGGISKKNRKAGVEAGVKVAPGLGGSVKGKAGLVW